MTLMNLKNIILSEIIQTQKTIGCMIPFVWSLEKANL